jgi:hypothetical protein
VMRALQTAMVQVEYTCTSNNSIHLALVFCGMSTSYVCMILEYAKWSI